jgi:hypothetical protein
MGIFLILVLVIALVLFGLVSAAPRGKRRRGTSAGYRGSRSTVQTLSREQIFTRWQTIQTMADTGGGNGLRQAVTEADKLLDHVMRQQGASGDTMRDRMHSFRNRFSNWPDITRAHGIRNHLAHDVGYDLVASQAKEAVADFGRALKDLGAL